MLRRKKPKKTLEQLEAEMNARRVRANQALMSQMEQQQIADTQTVMELQREQGKLLRKLMGD